ncbi:GNAT family N-acetyltransferase [Salinisphaera sp. Q1T1-3]|uniref:GNAT family N-acetyltransferase n=1 Tax=Salinisphaera sp. Q1T1-3 TaxID=2321229 RepID=UPI000E7131F5|nr:GNAT family N-acetyltransferase [Salinisphaera sp. Q1T1-3]RJS94997.1 GNAT family N-acetyltransferase [Salinisphaera sp. Q1T1-3]
MPTLRQIDRIEQISPAAWDALIASDQPFTRHGFLAALEASGSVSAEEGWQPAHALLEDDDGVLIAAAPLYLKAHSYGEFVFDFSWANAYHQIGLDYYPKLLNAIPFTPVAGPRLLARDDAARRTLATALADLPSHLGVSSLHSLFDDDASAAAMLGVDANARRGCQYRWFNRDYRDFDDFLSRLSAKRRKEIRRERRRVHDDGVQVVVRRPDEISEPLWEILYAFYGRTYAMRGQEPYLTRAFFHELSERMPEHVRFFIAYHDEDPVGMAFMMVGADTLYGRHWGCATDYHSLHFETCYYAGIDYCIAHGLACFDAGAQGEHKIRRGFEPVTTWSTHIMVDPRLRDAVADFVEREGDMMAEFEADQWARSSFADDATREPS